MVLEQLAGELARQLRERGQGVVRLECRLQCSDSEPVELVVGLFQPTAWAAHLVQLLQVQFDNLRLPGPVESVRLTAPLTAPLEFRQQELFSAGRPRRHPRQLASLIERMSNRLGHTRVMRVSLVPEAQPELACHYKPWVEGRGSGAGVRGHNLRRLQSDLQTEPAEATTLADIPPRPVRLLTRPVPIESSRHTPCAVRCISEQRTARRSVPATLTHRWGPERIETGWWRGRTAVRDYYRVETISGRRYWVFRRLTDGQWFLHGVFD
jgi:protein ImuB